MNEGEPRAGEGLSDVILRLIELEARRATRAARR
jgi:hypothetical protein